MSKAQVNTKIPPLLPPFTKQTMTETTTPTTTYALDAYFDETTMSLHLKEDRPILRKKGFP
jgi:predicted PilT family ATPase